MHDQHDESNSSLMPQKYNIVFLFDSSHHEVEGHLSVDQLVPVLCHCVKQVPSHANKSPIHNNEQLVIPVSDLSFLSHLVAHSDE